MSEFRGRALRYAGAIGISLVVLALMFVLDPYLPIRQTPFLFFVGAIALSARYGGTDAGLLTTGLSTFLARYYLVEPRYPLYAEIAAHTQTVLFIVQGGMISYLCGSLRETSEKHQQLAARWVTVLQQMPVGVWLADAVSEELLLANEQGKTILGHGERLPISLEKYNDNVTFASFFADGQPVAPEKWPIARSLKTGEIVREETIDLRWTDGRCIFLQINSAPIVADRGEIVAVVAIFADISEQVRTRSQIQEQVRELGELNTQLIRMNHLLGQRDRELDRFAYVVSHDLKAPLRAIANLSVWIEEDLEEYLTGDSRHQMNLLRGRVYRLDALIDGLLAYVRVDRIESKSERVEVEKLLGDVIDSLGITPNFRIKIGSDQPILQTKRISLTKVFSHLIGNALKHNDRPDGSIEIEAIDLGDWIEFTVKDDGPGIAPEFHDRIFGIFQTLKPRDQEENTGIGLSIVQKIIDTEGGKIWVDSHEGAGATFHFTWPHQKPTV